MSFETGQLLDQSPNARYDRVREDMYKLTQGLNKHILETGCIHCKQILKQSISTNLREAGRDNTRWYDDSADTTTQNNGINFAEVK